MMAQLVCEELTLGYDRPILTGLSFEVNAGDYLFILGENGAGKSTLMKTVLGLIPPLEMCIRDRRYREPGWPISSAAGVIPCARR